MEQPDKPVYTQLQDGDKTGAGVDTLGFFMEFWDSNLNRSVRFRPSSDQPVQAGQVFQPANYTGEWNA